MPDRHLDSDRIAAYGERRLSAEERAQVESRLADCAECRQVASNVAILAGRDRRGRKRVMLAGALGVAALASLVVFTGTGRDGLPVDSERLRPGGDSGVDAAPRIEALLPVQHALVDVDSLRFHWRSLGRDALYLLVLTDSAGQTVWEGRLGDTTLVLPATISLHPGARYIWLVDVLLPDGGVATTGPREFRIAP